MIIWAYGSQKHRIQGENSGMNLEMNSRGIVSAKVIPILLKLFLFEGIPCLSELLLLVTYCKVRF